VSSSTACRVKEAERPTSGRLMGGRSGGRVATRPAAERPGRCHTWTTASARPHGVAPRALLDEEQRRAEIIAQTLQSVDVAAPFELSERQLAGTQCALEARAVRLEVDRPLTEVEVHDMMVADDPASPRDPSASKQYGVVAGDWRTSRFASSRLADQPASGVP